MYKEFQSREKLLSSGWWSEPDDATNHADFRMDQSISQRSASRGRDHI
jgi:hypothetical protein